MQSEIANFEKEEFMRNTVLKNSSSHWQIKNFQLDWIETKEPQIGRNDSWYGRLFKREWFEYKKIKQGF